MPFGRYDLLDRISAGGMAEVFRARDTRTDGIVALKRILPEIAEDEDFIRMFEDEARIASQLEHPHIARTLDFGHVDQSYYIAFEFVDGRDLRTLFDRAVRNRARPPLGILLYVFSRIAEGLSYAHSRKDADGLPVSIVHRDVSPQNIVVSYDGDVKLIDFGIAKAAGKLSRTQVGTLKGKFGYMSPEQVRGNDVDHRADIFSLGICMWELFTLERLFNAENELLVLEKVRSAPITPPSNSNREVPAELDRIVLKALAKDVNERYRAAKDLYRDLNHFAQTTGTMATRDEVANYMQRAFPESAPERHADLRSAPRSGERSEQVERNERRESRQQHQDHKRGYGESFESVSSNKGRSQARVTDMEAEAHQETRAMAADSPSSDKRSDLDIFEGLGKKNTARPSAPPPPPRSSTAAPNAAPAGVSAPPPPPERAPLERGSQSGPAPGAPSSSLPSGLAGGSQTGSQSAPPPSPHGAMGSPSSPPPLSAPLPRDLVVAKKTLLGIPAPGASGAGPSRIPTPPPRSAPPPPPGRGSLPQVVPPPPRAGTIPPPTGTRPGPIVVPASSIPKPSTANAGPKLDMDWDDEDEATHIFDKAGTDFEQLKTDRPRPAAGTPLAPPASPVGGGGGSGVGSLKAQTLLGMNSPFAPPGNVRTSAPPPPPPGQGGLAFPHPPPTIDPSSIAAHTTAPGGATAPVGTVPPPPNPPPNFGQTQPMGHSMPAQVNTAPMPMPGPRAGAGGAGGGAASMPPPYQPQDGSLSQPGVPYPAPHAPNRMMEATQLVRPQASGRMGLVGMGVLFAALAAGLVIFLTMPRTGRIAINVADAKGSGVNHVEIFVDGTKHCDTAPCIVDQVNAGTHSLKVIAPGYEQPGDRAVTVEARKDAQIDFSLTPTGQKSGTGIKISGNQSGVKLFIDGKEIGPLPQEIRDLTPGAHTIRLAGTDRYAALDKNIIVASDEMQDLGQQTLKVVKGKATITLGTPGAKVSIVSGTDRREFPTLPIAVDLDTTKAWALEASKPGFVDYHQVVSFDDGQAEKTFNIVLDAKGAAQASGGGGGAAAAPATPAAPPAFVASTPRATPTPKPAAAAANDGNDAPAAASGDSFLNINSIPASSVVLDGKPIGNTPKVHISVSPGAHTVLFVNAEQGLKKQISVTVAAGETKPAIAKLRE